MSALPLFPVTTVGSWPRPPAVLLAQRQLRRGHIGRAGFDAVLDEAVREVVRLQELAGCDLVTDGELRRDNLYAVETSDDIRRAIERALQHHTPERLFLNPDCGFGTFSNRPMNSTMVATAKLPVPPALPAQPALPSYPP